MTNRKQLASFVAAAILASLSLCAKAQAGGIAVGSSTLITTLDYSDTFTLTSDPGGPSDNHRYDGTFPVDATGRIVQSNYGNPSRVWPASQWAIVSDATATGSGGGYPGSSGAGSTTGLTQTGFAQLDAAIQYGLRSNFVVQFDAVQGAFGHVDIFTGSDGTINGGMSIFFRPTGSAIEVGIFNGTTEFTTGLGSGVVAGTWHNYAVHFAPTQLGIYIDQTLLGSINLSTFNGGSFLGYSNAYVGVGAGPLTFVAWTDNFQVGGPVPVPEPSSVGLIVCGIVSLSAMRGRYRCARS